MIINGQGIIEGTKEDYIYFLLKNTKFYPYRIFPLYEIKNDGADKLHRPKRKMRQNLVNNFNEQQLFVFTHKYVLLDELYKIKKNKLDNFYFSTKKYKYKILWSKNIIKVNEEINRQQK
jgi:hypothetical protein